MPPLLRARHTRRTATSWRAMSENKLNGSLASNGYPGSFGHLVRVYLERVQGVFNWKAATSVEVEFSPILLTTDDGVIE
jgi:hypothetical protein